MMPKKANDPATISLPRAAKFAGVGIATIRAAVDAGQIPVLRIGKRLRVLRVPFEGLLLTGGFGDRKGSEKPATDEGGATGTNDR